MPPQFNAYHKWLGIPPEETAGGGPNHYRLLGIRLFEADPDVIENAADQRMTHLRSLQSGKHSVLSQKLLNEVAAARVCLLDPVRRKTYDADLRVLLAPAQPASLPVSRAIPLPKPAPDLPVVTSARPVVAASAGHASAFPTWLVATMGAVGGCVVLLVAVIAISSWSSSAAARPKAKPQAKLATADSPVPKLPTPKTSEPKQPPAPEPKPKPIPDLPAGRGLLVMQYEDELQVAREACERWKLRADYQQHFDLDRRDYSEYATIVCGSNNMDDWSTPEGKRPEAFEPVARFVERGGHLVVFGSFNGRNCEHLQQFGITTGVFHATTFASAGPATDLLVAGVADLLPASGQMRSAGSFTCKEPHEVLLRIGPGRREGEPALVTIPHGSGRLTYTGCEPNWKKDLWLITVLLHWISRGSPVP
jgi:hypothetical protein